MASLATSNMDEKPPSTITPLTLGQSPATPCVTSGSPTPLPAPTLSARLKHTITPRPNRVSPAAAFCHTAQVVVLLGLLSSQFYTAQVPEARLAVASARHARSVGTKGRWGTHSPGPYHEPPTVYGFGKPPAANERGERAQGGLSPIDSQCSTILSPGGMRPASQCNAAAPSRSSPASVGDPSEPPNPR